MHLTNVVSNIPANHRHVSMLKLALISNHHCVIVMNNLTSCEMSVDSCSDPSLAVFHNNVHAIN